MKKVFAGLAVAAVFTIGSVSPAQAASAEIGPGMGEKVKRGFIDTFTGWLEWPVQTVKGWKRGVSWIENETGSKITGTAIGLIFTGPAHAVGRTGSGLGELFGFWTANPTDNDGVGNPFDAEFAWDDGEAMGVFTPTLNDGLGRWGRKIGRGLGNGLLGWLDFPGQIVKGCRAEGAAGCGKGFVKGLWFGVSRTAYGFDDFFGFFLPNHKDQKGYAFEEKWAWESFNVGK